MQEEGIIVVISGSRGISDYDVVEKILIEAGVNYRMLGKNIKKVLVGDAGGVDQLVLLFCQEHKIPYRVFPADWERYGNSAGVKRTAEMIRLGDKVICIWDGRSRGTKHSIDIARKYKKLYGVYRV